MGSVQEIASAVQEKIPETLRIVDETCHRGTLYKAHKGKPAQSCELTSAERESQKTGSG